MTGELVRGTRGRLAGLALLGAVLAVAPVLDGRLAAGATTGVANAASSAPKSKLFGISVAPVAPDAAGFQRMGKLGTSAVRLQLSWGTIERKQGVRNWSYFDAALTDAAKAGVRVVPVLFGVPPWISSDATTLGSHKE